MATILIVEDRPPDRRLLVSLFRHSGHQVLEASDGAEALNLLMRTTPDLVISDILMPTVDGYELVRRMRDIPGAAQIPVIFYTATYHEREARALAQQCGVAEILTKPSDSDVILAKVNGVLQRGMSEQSALSGDQFDRHHAAVIGSKLVEKVRVLEETEHRTAALVHIGQQFSTERDPQSLIRAVCASGRDVTLAQYAVLILLDRSGTDVDLVVTNGVGAGQPRQWFDETALRTNLVQAIIRGRQTVRRRNATGRPEAIGLPASHPDVSSFLGAPICSPTRVYGCLVLGNKLGAPEFTESDGQVAATLGAQAGVAFENACLVRELHDHAEALEREIERRTHVEEQLRANEQRFRELANAMPQMVWTATPEGTLEYFNQRWFEFSGWSEAQSFAPSGWTPLIHPEDRDSFNAAWYAAVSSHRPCVAEFRFEERASGTYRWFLARALPTRDAAGHVVRWHGTFTDIHDQKETEERLRQANRARDEFLAIVSHELRTPLNAVLGWSRVLASSEQSQTVQDSARTARALQAVQRNAKSLAHVIDDLLNMSGVISGQVRLMGSSAVDLSNVVEAARESLQLELERKSLTLTFDIDRSLEPIPGDSNRLQQVVSNLLSNAIKFTPEGGRIDVRLSASNERARLVVRDSGIGISRAFLPYVFDPFRQADSTSTRAHDGLGLGLAIAHHFVQLHGGTIAVESPGEGQGTSFTVELPLAGLNTDRRKLAVERPGAPRPELTGKAVLVVDDDADARELLSLMLKQAGASVVSVPSADAALARLSREPFDALVSDIVMPQEDGYGLITRVRTLQRPNAAAIPAVAVTGRSRVEDRTRALLAGFQQCLSKPIDPAELVANIAALVRTPARNP